MASVSVLCPNGRRQNVKITPNTKILQVLEEVCKKQGFLPSEDYNLIHGRKIVDVTLSVRFSGLPNNAKLELVKAETSRAEQDVLIALQLETGERHQGTFAPSTPLWTFLLHWENQISTLKDTLTNIDTSVTPPAQPVCIHMREEVVGMMALQDTSLRKLGLTGGKAVIRHCHRQVDDASLADIVNKLEKEKLKDFKLNEMAARQISMDTLEQKPSVSGISDSNNTVSMNNVSTLQGQSTGQSNNDAMSHDISTSQSESMDIDSEQKSSSSECAAMESESTTSDQIVSQRGRRTIADDTVSTTSVDMMTSSDNNDRNNAVRALNNIPGIDVTTPQEFLDLTPEEQAIGRRLATSYLFSVGLAQGQQQEQQQMDNPISQFHKHKKIRSTPQHNFSDFKFPEETKGKELYSNELSDTNSKQYKPCDREALVFNLEEKLGTSSIADQDIPDDFFEVNEKDVKKMMVDLRHKVESMTEQPLLPKSLKEALHEEKYSKYERVVVRVQFPNKLVLQGVFQPRETVFALQKFVKEHLENKGQDFYLYKSPPKVVLKDHSKTLIQADLVPASLVYFGLEGDSNVDTYLSNAVNKEISSRLEAEKIVDKWLGNSSSSTPAPQQSSSTPAPGASAGSRPKAQSSGGVRNMASSSKPQSGGSTSDKGVPKWFKVGKK